MRRDVQLPWRYRLYSRLPRWARRIWGYDWVEDDRLTRTEILSIFYSLGAEPTVAPRSGRWIQYGPTTATSTNGSSITLYWLGRNHL